MAVPDGLSRHPVIGVTVGILVGTLVLFGGTFLNLITHLCLDFSDNAVNECADEERAMAWWQFGLVIPVSILCGLVAAVGAVRLRRRILARRRRRVA